MCKKVIGWILIAMACIFSIIGMLAHFMYQSIRGGWDFSERFWGSWCNENLPKKW